MIKLANWKRDLISGKLTAKSPYLKNRAGALFSGRNAGKEIGYQGVAKTGLGGSKIRSGMYKSDGVMHARKARNIASGLSSVGGKIPKKVPSKERSTFGGVMNALNKYNPFNKVAA